MMDFADVKEDFLLVTFMPEMWIIEHNTTQIAVNFFQIGNWIKDSNKILWEKKFSQKLEDHISYINCKVLKNIFPTCLDITSLCISKTLNAILSIKKLRNRQTNKKIYPKLFSYKNKSLYLRKKEKENRKRFCYRLIMISTNYVLF